MEFLRFGRTVHGHRFTRSVSSCNLVASIVSSICIIFKQWSFSGSEDVVLGEVKRNSEDRFTKSHSFIAKDSRSFGAVKKAADKEFAGGYSVILILVCISASLRFRFLT